MSEPEFPIYCKSEGGAHAHMIISSNKVLSITNVGHEISIALTDFYGTDHPTYDDWKRSDLLRSNAKDFNMYRIEMNNRLISIGVSKKAQPEKS